MKISNYKTVFLWKRADCFIQDNSICVHTRTGGGNRDFYESEEICRQNYPAHFGDNKELPTNAWNSDLRNHPNFVTDYDDDFDCTYANFIFSFPEDYKQDLEALAKDNQDHKPSEKWQLLFKSMEKWWILKD